MSNESLEKKIEELKMLEAQIQQFLAQKQVLQVQINEIENALSEVQKSDDEVYKIISGVMIRSTKEKIRSELNEKKKMFDVKISSMEKQEKIFEKNSLELRREIEKMIAVAEKNTKS